MKDLFSISPELIKNILNDYQNAVFSIDKNFNIRYFNKKASELSNKVLQNCEGKNIFDEITLFSSEEIKEIFNNLKEGESKEIEFKQFCKKINARISFSNDSINIWFDENWITKETERLSLALDGLNDAIWEWNINLEEMYFSSNIKKMLGYGEDIDFDVINKWKNLIHPNDKQETEKAFEDCVSGKNNRFETEFRLKHKNGNWIHVLSRSFAVSRDKTGNAIRILGMNTDVSEQRKTIQNLEDSQSFLELIYKNSNVGLAIGDKIGNITLCNPAFCDMTGYEKSELIGKNFGDITYNEDLPKEVAFVEQIAKGEISSYRIEKRYIRKDGSLIWVRANIAVVKNHSDEIVNYVGVIDNITEKKKMKNF